MFVRKTFQSEVETEASFQSGLSAWKALEGSLCLICFALLSPRSKNVWLIFGRRRQFQSGFLRDGWTWSFSSKGSQTSWALVCMIPVLKRHDAVRSECSDQSITLHYVYRYSNIPLMELFIYVHFVWYRHCDYMCFIQFTSLLFTWSMCLVNKQYCLIIVVSTVASIYVTAFLLWFSTLLQGEICS